MSNHAPDPESSPVIPSPIRNPALQRACAAAGGQKSLAARIGATQSMVWYWLARARRGVPGEYVRAIEQATGVSRHELRPDLYPAPDLASDPSFNSGAAP
jgi:DNA-binding transcriptional regulator YdaS (Cro superfamily)